MSLARRQFRYVVINAKHYSDDEVLSVLIWWVKQLNIDKKDRPFKIHIVVMTKDDAAEVCEALYRCEYIMLDAY